MRSPSCQGASSSPCTAWILTDVRRAGVCEAGDRGRTTGPEPRGPNRGARKRGYGKPGTTLCLPPQRYLMHRFPSLVGMAPTRPLRGATYCTSQFAFRLSPLPRHLGRPRPYAHPRRLCLVRPVSDHLTFALPVWNGPAAQCHPLADILVIDRAPGQPAAITILAVCGASDGPLADLV